MKLCVICGKEIIHNGFKWMHGRSIHGSIEIGAPQPRDHDAISAEDQRKEILFRQFSLPLRAPDK